MFVRIVMADNCSICQSSFEYPKFLKCGHTFCKSCLDSYMNSSFRKEFIVCPLCRFKTQLSEHGTQSLMDNFIASDTSKRNSIIACSDCRCITFSKLCDHCNSSFCNTCFTSHVDIVESERKQMRLEDEDLEVDAPNDDDIDSRSTMGLQGFVMSDTTHSKFCFELKGKIVVPNSSSNEQDMHINASILHAFDMDKCVVAPDHSNTLIYYNIKGEEIDKTELDVRVMDITMGSRGFLLLLDDRTNYVHEVENGVLNKIIQTFEMHPYAISSMNNGRIVLVGHGQFSRDAGMIQIYEYYGQLIRTLDEKSTGLTLGKLRSVDVNMENNDIYVGNRETGIVYHFQENGTYESSIFLLETLANLNVDIPLEDIGLIAPIPIC